MATKSKKSKPAKKPKPAKIAGDAANTSPNIQSVRVADIKVVEKEFRDLDEKTVLNLAESFQQVGLMHLPTVCIKNPKDASGPEQLQLVAGRHRLAAASARC